MAKEFSIFDQPIDDDSFFDFDPSIFDDSSPAEEFDISDLPLDNDLFYDFDPSIVNDSSPAEDFGGSSPDSLIVDIESKLMSDENLEEESVLELDPAMVSEFVASLLVDNPTSDSGTVDQVTTEKETEGSDDSRKENTDVFVEKKSNDSGSEVQDDEGDDDAVAKKRRRRLRNRDAAVRSRERKKEYVQDLEKKTKYLERELLRVGRMFECIVAENQSLRYCLEKSRGNETSKKTKQESAVLLLESLLLGSLLWLLGVNMICQFPCMSHTKCYLLPSEPEKVVLNGQGSNKKPSNKGVSRRCKGSRPRMKHQILNLVA